MPKNKEYNQNAGELIPFPPSTEIIIMPPDAGIIGRFLEETANMFKARAMRMSGLLRRINESGQRTEAILRSAAECMEAAEATLEEDLTKQGLLPDSPNGNGNESQE